MCITSQRGSSALPSRRRHALTRRSGRAIASFAATIAVCCVLAPRLAAPPAAASAPRSGTAPGDFQEVAVQGFGDRANSEAWSMAWFNGRLLVGTARNLQCYKAAGAYLFGRGPYPPHTRDILCPGTPPTIPALPPTLGAQIWSLPLPATGPITQSNWTMAYQSPLTNTFTLLGQQVSGPPAMGFRGMSVFDDGQHAPTLFVSGVSLKLIQRQSAPPPPLLASTDGVSFAPVPADPGTVMGDINTGPYCCLRDSLQYNGKFYLAVTNMSGAGAVDVATSPWNGDNAFQQFTPGSTSPMTSVAMAVFNGYLYLGGGSPAGYTVWRTDAQCAQLPCPWSAFTSVVPPGGGLGANGNSYVLSMQVFTDTLGVAHLYVGTDGAATNQPIELIRINADDSWDLIAGKPRTVNGVLMRPTSQLPAGFGWPYNFHVWRMAVHDGILYVGTFDASTSRKHTPGGSLLQNKMGFDLYATRDGVTLTKVTDTGFGDLFSDGVRTMQDTPYGLFVGSNNIYYGLRIWQGGLSPAGLALAPFALVASRASQGQTALAWSAPPTATLFTVYRAALTPQVDQGTTYWTESDDTPIATTTATHFVDGAAPAGTTYFYHIVAQDAQGDVSEPSNTVASTMANRAGVSAVPRRAVVDSAAAVPGRSLTPARQGTRDGRTEG